MPGGLAITDTTLSSPVDSVRTVTAFQCVFGDAADDFGRCVVQSSDSGYVMLGSTYSHSAGYCDLYLVKTHANGETSWTTWPAQTQQHTAVSLLQETDGGFTLGSNYRCVNALPPPCDFPELVRTDSAGLNVWSTSYRYVDHYDVATTVNDVARASTGGYYLVGTAVYPQQNPSCLFVNKTTPTGDTSWTRLLSPPPAWGYEGLACAATADGEFVITGETISGGDTSVYVTKNLREWR